MTPEPPEERRREDRPVFTPPGHDPQYGRRYARWAIWSCGGLLLAGLLLLLGFMLVALKGPNGKALITESESVAICREHLVAVSGALGRYHTDKGKAPATLADLYPTYLADKSDLHCPSDPEKEGVSYGYRPGVAWGKGQDIVVFCPHHRRIFSLRGLADDKKPHILLYIRQDGQVALASTTAQQMKALLKSAQSGKPLQ